LAQVAAMNERPKFSPCELCEHGWQGLIEAKIELAERLRQMAENHNDAMRLMAKWQSRALKAEAALQERDEQ
jgi:hypothetical protein